jgi:pyruvate/2-oxoglutarate dehydrogenase complex dihydrolipoamide acyltransferase (E2) component
MATNTTVEVVMPAMGESVSDGTILEWHKQEGDPVSEDETIVEISTDKVDAEVPAPAAGTVAKIHAAEGDTVNVGEVLAEIAVDGSGNGGAPAPAAEAPPEEAPPAEAPAGEEARSAGHGRPEAGPPDQIAGQDAPRSIPITMPAMGESVSEGTILEWAKQPGDAVQADETIVEISTDKVDAEVPAPASGTLT